MANRKFLSKVYLVGEGKSEKGYGRWLMGLALKRKISITVAKLGGGDPFKLVDGMVKKLNQLPDRSDYHCLLLDDDRFGEKKSRDEEGIAAAKKYEIYLICQVPDHEGFLLHHFKNYTRHTPPKGGASLELLKKLWPDYKKGMDATGYEKMLTLEHLERARKVETAFDNFLTKAGWPRES